MHRNILSNNSLKSFNHSKYNKVYRSQPIKDITKEYEIHSNGWRRIKKL